MAKRTKRSAAATPKALIAKFQSMSDPEKETFLGAMSKDDFRKSPHYGNILFNVTVVASVGRIGPVTKVPEEPIIGAIIALGQKYNALYLRYLERIERAKRKGLSPSHALRDAGAWHLKYQLRFTYRDVESILHRMEPDKWDSATRENLPVACDRLKKKMAKSDSSRDEILADVEGFKLHPLYSVAVREVERSRLNGNDFR